MPASELGPWGRIYFRVAVDKAHYPLDALGAFLKVWANLGLVTPRGFLKKRAIVGLIGQPMFDFLVEEGDLVEESPGVFTLHRWDWYQAPLTQNATRQKRHRDNAVETVDNGVTVRDHNVTVTQGQRDVPYSPSTSSSRETTNEEETTAVDARGDPFDPWDPIDAFYLTTGQFPPEGGKLRPWITDVASKGPTRQDFGIVFADEWKKNGLKVPETLRATEARLSKMGERARKAESAEQRRKANRSIFETPMMREYREAVAANYDKPQNGNGTAVKGGPLTAIGDVLGSMQRPDRSLTVDRSPEAESTAAALLVQAQNGTTPPAPPERSGSADNVPAEPGEPGPGRDNAPTDGASTEVGHGDIRA